MPELEKDIEKKLVKYAESLGMLTFKFTSPSNAGVVDRIFIYRGQVFFMEIKTVSGKLTPLQKRHGAQLIAHDAHYGVAYGYAQGEKLLNDFEHWHCWNEPF